MNLWRTSKDCRFKCTGKAWFIFFNYFIMTLSWLIVVLIFSNKNFLLNLVETMNSVTANVLLLLIGNLNPFDFYLSLNKKIFFIKLPSITLVLVVNLSSGMRRYAMMLVAIYQLVVVMTYVMSNVKSLIAAERMIFS